MTLRAVAIAGLVLFGFLVSGQFLLEAVDMRFGSFQIAGGIVLFMFALTMIFGEEAKSKANIAAVGRDPMAGAVFPLTMPSTASSAPCWPSC